MTILNVKTKNVIIILSLFLILFLSSYALVNATGACGKGIKDCGGGTCCAHGCCDRYKGRCVRCHPHCTNTCPVTASAKSSPWIEGIAPANYIPSCKASTSKSGTTSSCGSCTDTRNWHLPNLPTSVAQTQSIQYCLNGSCKRLSTDPNNPTAVEITSATDTAKLKAINPALTEGRGRRYDWTLKYLEYHRHFFRKRVSNQACTGLNHCQTGDTDQFTDNFGSQFFTNRGEYSIGYTNGVLQSCTNDVVYASTSLNAYFVLNHIPEVITKNLDEKMGTEPDSDNGRVCTTDNNPVEFTLTYRDGDGANEISRLGFWIDNITPAAGQVSDSVHGVFDISGGSYSALGYDCTSGTCDWSVAGNAIPDTSGVRNLCSDSLGTSDKSETNGGCTDRIGSWTITDIRYDANGTDISVDYKVWIDKNLGSNLDIYGYTKDIKGASSGWVDTGNILLDLNPPLLTLPNAYRVVDNTKIEIDWSAADALTGVTEIYGYADLQSSGQFNGPVTDITSGVNNYKITGDTYQHGSISNNDSRDLWTLINGTTSRTEQIDLLQNEGNEITFGAETVDGVCNMGDDSSGQQAQSLDDAWLTTKGGAFYSDNGVGFPSRSIEDDGYYLTREDALWTSPYRFKVDAVATGNNDIATSTELYSVNSGGLNFPSAVTNPAVGFGLNNYLQQESNLYSSLDPTKAANLNGGVNVMNLGIATIDTTTMQTSTDIHTNCDATSDFCVFSRTGDLTISTSGGAFVCNKPTVFIVDGNLTLEPDILKGTQPLDGCMFIAQGNIIVETGMQQTENPSCNSGTLTDSTVCYPPYDSLDAMLIADGQIIIKEDFNTLLYEGLLIHGSMIATGGTGSPAIASARSLKLINNPRFPSVVTHYDPVYLKIGRSVFHFSPPTYVIDVGYKP